MPRFNPYSVPSRGDKQAQATALDQSQQQLDQSQQHDWVNQIASLYGIQQQQQMLPGQLQGQQLANTHMGLQNTNQQLQNDYLPSNEDAKQAGMYAMAGVHDARAGLDPTAVAHLVQSGVWTPEYARMKLMTPEEQAAEAQATQAKTQTRWQNMEGDARANGVSGQEGTIMQEFGPDNLEYLRGLHTAPPAHEGLGAKLGSIPAAIPHIPEYLQNLETGFTNFGQDFWGKLFGLTPQKPTPKGQHTTRAWPWSQPEPAKL